jgi:type IV pilus assembly protein PilC
VLFGLSRHLDLTRQIRNALTRAIAYPAVVLIAILCISALLSAYVMPQLLAMFDPRTTMDWGFSWRRAPAPRPGVPMVTVVAQYFGLIAPYLAGAAVLMALLVATIWPLVRVTTPGRWVSDQVLMRFPLIGRPLRYSLVGRWCDVASIGVHSGLDLPSALTTAADAIGSDRLRRDTERLVEAHSAGRGLDSVQELSVLPASVPGALQLALGANQLAPALATLRDIYLRQAQTRARMIPMTLMPLLILLMAVLIGGILMAIFVPILRLLDAMMR